MVSRLREQKTIRRANTDSERGTDLMMDVDFMHTILNNLLAIFFLAYVLFFFVKETMVSYAADLALVCMATLVTTLPMWASSALRNLEVPVPGWLLFLDASAGVAIRLSIVVLCYALAAWSPWMPRRSACDPQTTQ
ncbi:hypothetical protein KTD31_02095 [Burkholderia multivorans]|jgi:hypothetical protein|uniref:hypothetical protein n=1 Tax=Burkholderia multivorans TaxID=87883 RepID=UPI001C22FE27|nr:hypothetical protein [Burkholderia multivorans]MBU9200196.1 hypothetical protein [Burkholderia multivorans]MDN8078679.1 hypothetical protein [Burkholderia multivorans]